jgi:hypothetical protein
MATINRMRKAKQQSLLDGFDQQPLKSLIRSRFLTGGSIFVIVVADVGALDPGIPEKHQKFMTFLDVSIYRLEFPKKIPQA